MSRFFNKKKHSTPEIPAWSPTAVLIGPNGAWLRSSDGIRYIHHGMIEWWDLGFCDVCRAENRKKFCSKKKFGSIKKKLFKKKNLVPEKKNCANEKKHSTPKIPVWSPTTVLIRPNGAWLRSSNGMRYIHHGVIEWWDVWFLVVPRLCTDQRTVKFMFQLSHLGQVRVGVVGNISACHADAPGSIPGHGVSVFFFRRRGFLLSWSLACNLILFFFGSTLQFFCATPMNWHAKRHFARVVKGLAC